MSVIPASALTDGWPDDQATTLTLADSGIVLNGADTFGVKWLWSSSDAVPKAPVREITGPNEIADGDWDATRSRGSLVFDISGRADAPNHAALHAAKRRLWELLGPETFDVTVTEPGFTGIATVRQQGTPTWNEVSNGRAGLSSARFNVALYSRRSYVESAALRAFTLDYAVESGGVDYTDPGLDYSDPGVDYSSSSVSGVIAVHNPGPRAVPMLLHLTAPSTYATLVVQQGPDAQVLNLLNPFGDLLTAGQTLDVDTRIGTVLLNGTAIRNSWATGTFPKIPKGDSTITLLGPSVGGQITGSFRAVYA
ncbi:MAG: hypothetical protein JWQ74_438 [Marmoricola sp.]|nr:hypothetical protein [Marmoricola sp.]